MTTAQWSQDPALISFYESHRRRPEDLYRSERRFLPWLASEASSVLDVGCALGGFKDIWRHFNPAIEYTGVDLSARLVEHARVLRPDSRFLQGHCAEGLPLPDRAADVVQALGWLHWEPKYAQALAELWRLAGRWLFFDARLRRGRSDLEGRQWLTFTGSELGTATPYIACSWAGFAELLSELLPTTVFAYGYWGPPADSVDGIDEDVCFVTFVLGRGDESGTKVAMNAPLPWPETWGDGVEALPDGWLQAHIPLEEG